MLQMSVNEFCGVTGFYHDSMLRLPATTCKHGRLAILAKRSWHPGRVQSTPKATARFRRGAMGALNPEN
jgi:hypothetical protein